MADTPIGELKAIPVHHVYQEAVTRVAFSTTEELLWSGTEGGRLHAHRCPELERYSAVRAHDQPLTDMVALPPSIGNGVISLSGDTVRYHLSGGVLNFTYIDDEGKDLTACTLNPRAHAQLLLGRHSGILSLLDMDSEKLMPLPAASKLDAVLGVRAPVGQGLVAVGCANGQVSLLDLRAGYKVEQVMAAHPGGLVAMDASGGLLATSGLGTRQGQLVTDLNVKVYDLRSTARVMNTVPFTAGPALLRFHPRFSGTLLVASSSGIFSMSDVQSSSFPSILRVETEGDALTTVDISSSGECLAFGGSGGFIHLWGYNQTPRVNLRSVPIELPPAHPEPSVLLNEGDSFAAIAPLYPAEGRALSEWEPGLMGKVGLPPRIVPPSLLADMKQVDFVGYINNPHFRRDRSKHAATAHLLAALRNTRIQPKKEVVNGMSARNGFASDSAVTGGLLPARYRKLHITLDTDRRYEEFDFARHNRTRFAGLENGIANCYANSLLQVLYFIPSLRAVLLASMPDPEREFSLLDELGLLFRMLASESGHACQATNLLRALRQSREATGLGLLEGHAQKGAHGADIEVEANKDRSLARRIQSLQRFLLDKLHHEIVERAIAAAPSSSSSSEPGNRASEGTSAGVPGDSNGDPSPAGASPLSPAAEGKSSVVEQLFGIRMRQRMQSLQGTRPEISKEIRAFQVDLQYPRVAKAAPASPQLMKPAGKEAAGDAAVPLGKDRPSFADILVASIKADSETRAWFSDEYKYQYVRQSRMPLAFPQVLSLGTGLQDRSNLVWWQPHAEATRQPGAPPERPWAPWAIALEVCNGQLQATTAESAAELSTEPASNASGNSRAVYELTAVVARVQEEDAAPTSMSLQEEEEGHLVAHIRVPPMYLDKEVGLLPTPRAPPPSPGFAARPTYFRSSAAFLPAPSLLEDPNEGPTAEPFHDLPDDPFGDDSSGGLAAEADQAGEGLPEDPFGEDPMPLEPPPPEADEASSRSQDPSASRLLNDMLTSHPLATDERDSASDSEVGTSQNGSSAQSPSQVVNLPDHHPSASEEQQDADARGGSSASTAGPLSAQDDGERPAELQVPERFSRLKVIDVLHVPGDKVAAERASSLPRTYSGGRKSPTEPHWLLINDFSIVATTPGEVLQMFGSHKVPCLLYYTQVIPEQEESRQEFQVPAAPVLTHDAFHKLCRAPPLQASVSGAPRQAKPSFWPLLPSEGPREGLLLGLDAEFVAFSPPSKAYRGGVEIETQPSRLGLARVSVVRGQSPQDGTACIDDYIRATEPVYDYLTQYSGLRPGDLDPGLSQHHLTTMKVAYLKLRYLIDCGCIFVGHGLKKDFRMINVVVPPSQIVDTVDLFYLKRHRKLSLRFLSAYLLQQDIQQVTHDSIEDARTALSLHKVYLKLEGEGRLQEVLQQMYSWGKQHGWDPQAVKEHGSPMGSPQTVTAVRS